MGKDVATAQGYAKPENAITTHVDADDKTTTLIQGTGTLTYLITQALFDKFLVDLFDLRSNFVPTQQRKCKLFFVFAAPKFGSLTENTYLCN